MARRSSRIQQVGEKSEVRCMWGLFSILESCQSRPSQKVISNGRALNRHILDYPRKLDPIASFDEECRKVHNGVGLRSVPDEGGGRSVRNCIEKHKSKRDMIKRHAEMDADPTYPRTRKSSGEAYQSSSCCLNNAARFITELPSTSAELSLNKLTVAAILGAACAQSHQEESMLSEYFQTSCYLEVEMRAKALVDQMFINRKFLQQGRNLESKSFSNALEALNSNKNPSPTEKDRVIGASGTPAMSKGSADDKLLKKIDYQLKSPTKTQPSDKIVILRPIPPCANISCNCSSLRFPYRSDRRVSHLKTTSFSFRKIKKKLKHTFGVTKNRPSQERSTLDVGSDCICDGLDIRNSFSSSTEDGKKGKLSMGSDTACVTDSMRRKLDFTSAAYSNKQDFDVIVEAKRNLSTRLNDLSSVEAVTSKTFPTTLERILSSPEPDFCPRRDTLYFPGSVGMGFSPYNTSPGVIEDNTSHVGNEHNKSLKTVDSNSSNAENMKIHGESKIAEMNNFLPHESRHSGEVMSEASITGHSEMTDTNSTQKCDGITIHSVLDSLPENEAVASVVDTAENIKYQEEHRSPVSVLEPFFVEDANSPPIIITPQTARKQLQPRRLDFEECSVELFPQYPLASVDSYTEEDHLCQYVQLVLEASSLNWDQLSEMSQMSCPPQDLLHESLFHEVELPPDDCYYDPKLLFDHIHEVLLEIYKFHFCSPPWLSSSALPKITSPPLVQLVLAKILEDEAEFFLLPTTERTLEQLVSRDVANSKWWVDAGLDTEHIALEISEAVMEESLLNTLLQFNA